MAGRMLLCTDGLWRHRPEADGLRAVLARRRPALSGSGGLLEEARSLVELALGAGGPDNVTALLIPVAPSAPPV
ncbi:hypothetical protein [Streptomyces sp. SAS_270]|uniref:hypothetical protein n=1 Tax=Streptomyces sp. SAS_270 TaxID=3412748 RepID=UPI00403CCFC5